MAASRRRLLAGRAVGLLGHRGPSPWFFSGAHPADRQPPTRYRLPPAGKEPQPKPKRSLPGHIVNCSMEVHMDWNRVEGNWKQIKGRVKEKWGKLTDDDLNVINGRREQLEGKIQERYGLAKDQFARILMTGTAVKSGTNVLSPA